jgi:hypothetical protein
MIFDEHNPSPAESSSGAHEPSRRRRRRRRSSSEEGSSSSSRRRRSGESVFREATRLDQLPRHSSDANTTAWLVVLGLLVAAVLGFAWYLHQERSAPDKLSGDAPSKLLMPFIDPILAPLETGVGGFSTEDLSSTEAALRSARSEVNLDDQEVYATAMTLTQILGEAAADRQRHLARLLKLGSPVIGMAPDPSARTDIGEAEQKHLELAVGISWQRNSVTYRNRVEELWYRLLRLEQGRFRGGSAPQSMMPELPASSAPNE